jgi:hypothetical protein
MLENQRQKSVYLYFTKKYFMYFDKDDNSNTSQSQDSGDSGRQTPDRDTSTYQERSENQNGIIKK